MTTRRHHARRATVTALATLCAVLAAGPLVVNHISNENARARLQRTANDLALAALLSGEIDDRVALDRALAASRFGTQGFEPVLKLTTAGGLRASEVHIEGHYAPPLSFLYPGRHVTFAVTGRAITRSHGS